MKTVEREPVYEQYRPQVIRISRAQAMSRIADVMAGKKDLKGECVAELATEIVEKLGWK